MAYDKGRRVISNGTNFKPIVNINGPSDSFKAIFEKTAIDIKSKGTSTYKSLQKARVPYVHRTNEKIDGKSVNEEVVKQLNSVNFYTMNSDKSDFNKFVSPYVFKFQEQTGSRASTVETSVDAWNKIQKFKTEGEGTLHVFDLETYGAKSKDLRWDPMGITEFAMHSYDFSTSATTETNILFTNDSVVNDLDDFLKRYEKKLSRGGVDAIKADEELKVTAMRMSVYDPERGAKFKRVGNVWQAISLGSTDDAQIGNIDSITRAVNEFKKMNKISKESNAYINPATGLTYDNEAFLKSVGRMSVDMHNNNGVVAGHNIINFDRHVTDKMVNKIYTKQQNIIDSTTSSPEAIEQAKAAIKYIEDVFGFGDTEYVGLPFAKGSVLDTLPIMRAARDDLGFLSPDVRLETLSNMFYSDRAALGVAHLGTFDVGNNMAMILDEAENLNGQSLIEHIMNELNGGLVGLNNANQAISLKSNQVFKATGSPMSANFSGKGFLNYVQYENGQIFTNGNFTIKNNEISHSTFTGNTGFNKNRFYQMNKTNKIEINALPKEVRDELKAAYPELNTKYLYHAAFESVDATEYTDKHTVNIFASTAEELEASLGTNLVHVADITDSGAISLIEKNIDHVTTATYSLAEREITESGLTSPGAIMRKAIISADIKYKNDAINRAVFAGDKKLKNISGLLAFDKEARSKGMGEGLDAIMTSKISLTSVLKGKSGTEQFTEQQIKSLQEMFTRHLGYKDKSGNYVIDFRTLSNVSAAYKNVMSRKDYYDNLIEITKQHYDLKKLKGKDLIKANDFFDALDEKATAEVAMDMGMGQYGVINAVTGSSAYSTNSMAHFKNRYDFKIGKGFDILGDKAKPIEDVFSLAGAEDVLTFNLGTPNAESKFINELYKLRMGDKAGNKKRTDIAEQKTQAMFEFLMDLDNHKKHNADLYANEEFSAYMSKLRESVDMTGMAPRDFNENIAASLLHGAIKQVKSDDASAGIVQAVGDINPTFVNKKLSKQLNAMTYDKVLELSRGVKTIKTYSEKEKKQLVKELVDIFGFNDGMFDEGYAALSPIERKMATMIRQDVNEKYTTYFTDIIDTVSTYGIDLHLDEAGRNIIVSKGKRQQVLDKLPKAQMDQYGKMYLQSGGDKIGLDLRLATRETPSGTRTYMTTNLDKNFGRKGFFSDLFESRLISNKNIELSDLNRYTGYHNATTREHSKYTGTKNDLMTINNRIDISATQEMYHDIFRPNGPLNYILDEVDLINEDLVTYYRKDQNLRRMKKSGVLDTNSLPPDLSMIGINDAINIARATLDEADPRYKQMVELFDYAGMSLKETALVNGYIQIGDRVVGNWINSFDNVQRPPMTGAGNIKFLDETFINKLSDHNIIPGSVMESNKTMRGIFREAEGINLTSDFRARQIYMSGPLIQERMASNKSKIMKVNINNRTIKEMTAKQKSAIYDKLIETVGSGTFEQARIIDGRVFNNIIDMPIDSQFLSANKDIIGLLDEGHVDNDKIKRLVDLAGDITRSEDGTYAYKRRAGSIVKKGEVVAESKGYGGVRDYFGSKHDKGVLFFSVTTNKHKELSDDAISKIVNEYSEVFDALESKEEKLNALFNILDSRGLKVGYRIDNANQASLFKILDSGTEKGMSFANNVTIGRYNQFNKEYFSTLAAMAGDTKYDLSNIVGNKRTVMALHEDVAAKNEMTVDQLIIEVLGGMEDTHGVNDINDILYMVQDEREALSELVFGKHGAFHGFASIANDNIPKHENIGLATSGNFSEAINKYARAANISHTEAVNKIAGAMQKDDNLNFIRYTKDGVRTNATGAKFTVNKHGMLVMDIVDGENAYLDNGRFNNLMVYTNDLIEELDIKVAEEDKLVHKDVYVYNKQGKLEHRETLVGSFEFKEVDGKKVVVGSTTFSAHSIVDDGETVSGVSQEFINAKKAINQLRARGDLTEVEQGRLRQLQEVVNAQKDHVKFNRINDQGMVVLGRERFNEAMAEDLTAALALDSGNDHYFTPEKADFLSRKTGEAIHYDKSTNKITIDDSIKNKGANEIYIDKLKEQLYYNDVFADELTSDMLDKEEYAHLKGVYDQVIGEGKSKKIGVHQAQNIYDLQGMAIATEFNTGRFDPSKLDEMANEGFEMMSIKDYTPTEGSAHGGTIESIRNKRLMLDLGDDFSADKRYIAVPAGGQQIGDSEVLAVWQGKINQLKRQSDTLESLEGGGRYGGYSYQEWLALTPEQKEYVKSNSKIPEATRDKYERVVASMQETREEMQELINRFPRKGGAYSDAVSIEVMEASQRLKILSVTSTGTNNKMLEQLGINLQVDPNSESFMKTAKVMMEDGTKQSLYDLQQQGIFYDFERAGIDYFINAGYFEDSMLEKFGFTEKQQMIDYLKENGTVRVSRRFPEILSTSIFTNRIYLDEDFNGKNIISVNAATMLKYLGDSDGDSESGWNVNLDNVNFALYERQRELAIEEVKDQGIEIGTKEFEQSVKQEMLDNGITKDAYEGFKNMSIGMDVAAAYHNAKWQVAAEETLLGDIANNAKVGAVGDIMYQIKNAKSETFKNSRMEAMHIHPTGKQVTQNVADVKAAITQALQSNPEAFEGKVMEEARAIAEGTKTITGVKDSNKYKVLDAAMFALESDKNLDKDVFGKMQAALVERVRTQQMFEEEVGKSTKSAIGSINNMLNSLKVGGEVLFTNESSPYFNPNMSRVLYEGAYQAEQKVISGKKIAFEIGDTRLVELEEILGKVKQGKGGQTEKDKLAEWFTTYMGEDSTNSIWDNIRPSIRAQLEGQGNFLEGRMNSLRLSDSSLTEGELMVRAKNSYIADTMVDSITRMVKSDVGAAAIKDISASNKKGSLGTRIVNSNIPGPESLITSQANNMLTGKTTQEAEQVIEKAASQSTSGLEAAAVELGESLVSSASLTKQDGGFGGLGMLAIGAAAGIMAAGYAGGGHQRPTRPKDDSQSTAPPMLDDGEAPDTGMRQQGYVINISADTNKGARHLKSTLKDIAKASQSNGSVSINMNYRTTNGGGYSNKDIENIINNFI